MRADLVVERVPACGRVQHIFEIGYEDLDADQRDILDDYFKDRRGRYLPTEFVDPWSLETFTCRLDSDSQAIVENSPFIWASRVRLVEVADFKELPDPRVTELPELSTGAVTQLPYRMERRYRTVVQPQADFSELRFEDFEDANGLQRWSVGGDALHDDETAELIDCWKSNLGPWGTLINFEEPETETIYAKVHFVETELVHETYAFNANRVFLSLQESRE